MAVQFNPIQLASLSLSNGTQAFGGISPRQQIFTRRMGIPATTVGTSSASQQMMIAMMTTIVTALIQKLTAGAIPLPNTTGDPFGNILQESKAPRVATPAASISITNTTTNAGDKSKLNDSLSAIAQDPDGAKLLAAAKAAGVKISVGDPGAAIGSADKDTQIIVCNCPMHVAMRAAAANATASGQDPKAAAILAAEQIEPSIAQTGIDPTTNLPIEEIYNGLDTTSLDSGGTVVNGVTLSNNNGGNVRVIVRDPNNIKTIAHELVHAISTADGNSKEEEGIADVIGSRVANRLGGADVGGLSGSDETIYTNKQKLYPELKQRNAIRQTLAGDGLSVNV